MIRRRMNRAMWIFIHQWWTSFIFWIKWLLVIWSIGSRNGWIDLQVRKFPPLYPKSKQIKINNFKVWIENENLKNKPIFFLIFNKFSTFLIKVTDRLTTILRLVIIQQLNFVTSFLVAQSKRSKSHLVMIMNFVTAQTKHSFAHNNQLNDKKNKILRFINNEFHIINSFLDAFTFWSTVLHNVKMFHLKN